VRSGPISSNQRRRRPPTTVTHRRRFLPRQHPRPAPRRSPAVRVRQEIPAQWWTLFRSEALDQLIRAALAQNPNMAAAEAALRQAQENYNAQAGSLVYPSVNAQLGVARQKTSVATAGGAAGVFNLYNASVNVAYTPDVFGATRRTLEGAQAAVDYQRFQVEATYLALSANVVTGAIQEASLRAQLKATRKCWMR
jgi:outer membrane protein TolC